MKAVLKEGQEPAKVYLPAGFHISPGETLKTPDHFPYYEDNDQIAMIYKPTGHSKSLTVVGIMEEPYYGTPGQGGYIAITGTDNTAIMNENVNAVLTVDLNTHEDCIGEIAKILDTSKTPAEREAALSQNGSYTTKNGERPPSVQRRRRFFCLFRSRAAPKIVIFRYMIAPKVLSFRPDCPIPEIPLEIQHDLCYNIMKKQSYLS